MAHVEVQLGVHGGVDGLLAESDESPPVHVLPLGGAHHGDGPVALPEGGRVGEGEDDGLTELLGGLVRSRQHHRAEECLAWLEVWVGLGVVHHTAEHVLGLARADGSLRHSEADVRLRQHDPTSGAGDRGPLGEESLRQHGGVVLSLLGGGGLHLPRTSIKSSS